MQAYRNTAYKQFGWNKFCSISQKYISRVIDRAIDKSQRQSHLVAEDQAP